MILSVSDPSSRRRRRRSSVCVRSELEEEEEEEHCLCPVRARGGGGGGGALSVSGPSSRRRKRSRRSVCVGSERSSLSNRTGGRRRETGEREEAKLKDPNSRLGSCKSDARAATRQSMEAALFGFRLQSVILDRYDTVHRHLDFFFPLHLA
ncbi:unnamed protein product [Sphagnum tenellum]